VKKVILPRVFRYVSLVILTSVIAAGGAEFSAARIIIKAVEGGATSSTNGLDFHPLHAGDHPGLGAILKTDSAATVDLILQDSGTVLWMRPDTTLKFTRLNKQPAGGTGGE